MANMGCGRQSTRVFCVDSEELSLTNLDHGCARPSCGNRATHGNAVRTGSCHRSPQESTIEGTDRNSVYNPQLVIVL